MTPPGEYPPQVDRPPYRPEPRSLSDLTPDEVALRAVCAEAEGGDPDWIAVADVAAHARGTVEALLVERSELGDALADARRALAWAERERSRLVAELAEARGEATVAAAAALAVPAGRAA